MYTKCIQMKNQSVCRVSHRRLKQNNSQKSTCHLGFTRKALYRPTLTHISSARQEHSSFPKSTYAPPQHAALIPSSDPCCRTGFVLPNVGRIEVAWFKLKQRRWRPWIELQRGFGHVNPPLTVRLRDLKPGSLDQIRCK